MTARTIRSLLEDLTTATLRGNREWEESLVSEDEAFFVANRIRDELLEIISVWIDVDRDLDK